MPHLALTKVHMEEGQVSQQEHTDQTQDEAEGAEGRDDGVSLTGQSEAQDAQ